MKTVKRYLRPSGLAEALAAKRAEPEAAYLAGGTFLLAGDGRDRPESLIDLGSALPRGVALEGSGPGLALSIGAGTSFQELAESRELPACLLEATLSMANRNTRNRATVGGNLAADKSCSSLIPILLALGAELELASPYSPEPRRIGLESWLGSRDGLGAVSRNVDIVLRILVPIGSGKLAAYRRWNRVSCDLSVLSAAVAYTLEGGAVRSLRIALGGLGPKARRFAELEALFEGSPLPSREGIEARVAPLLRPLGDLRASAAFKRLRGAQLLADALTEANP
jgi:probable selenate reductase FAD-binding subunit